jgi:hypothetical protein
LFLSIRASLIMFDFKHNYTLDKIIIFKHEVVVAPITKFRLLDNMHVIEYNIVKSLVLMQLK